MYEHQSQGGGWVLNNYVNKSAQRSAISATTCIYTNQYGHYWQVNPFCFVLLKVSKLMLYFALRFSVRDAGALRLPYLSIPFRCLWEAEANQALHKWGYAAPEVYWLDPKLLQKYTLGKSKCTHLLEWHLFVCVISTSLERLKDVQWLWRAKTFCIYPQMNLFDVLLTTCVMQPSWVALHFSLSKDLVYLSRIWHPHLITE